MARKERMAFFCHFIDTKCSGVEKKVVFHINLCSQSAQLWIAIRVLSFMPKGWVTIIIIIIIIIKIQHMEAHCGINKYIIY